LQAVSGGDDTSEFFAAFHPKLTFAKNLTEALDKKEILGYTNSCLIGLVI
jgi:hypothetical protein